MNDTKTQFKNPWPSAQKPTWAELWGMSSPISWSQDLINNPKAQAVDVVVPDWGAQSIEEQKLEDVKSIVGTWLGHASAMVQMPIQGAIRKCSSGVGDVKGRINLWVLFDPIFSSRAGPTQYTGPKRLRPPPCSVEDVPACDAVVISHNHYDHLDLGSIQAVMKKFPKCRYFVPLGNKAWFTGLGIKDEYVHQLDWWGHVDLRPDQLGMGHEKKAEDEEKREEVGIRFTCTPAQHNSGRGALDQDSTLWSGWVIEQILSSKSTEPKRRKGAVYYAGDTGLRRTSKSEDICPAFEEIGKKLGPFDLSFIPIWRGGTLSFISSVGLILNHDGTSTAFHTTPPDAIDIHKIVRSRNTIPVHFATFVGVENEIYEATVAYNTSKETKKVGSFCDEEIDQNGRTDILNIGGSIAVGIQEKVLD